MDYKILVIDDDPYTLEVFEVIGELLKNCSLLTATNCDQAKTILQEHLVDILILDIILPDQNGYEVCKELKQHPHAKDAYYIFMSVEKHNLIDRVRAYNLAAQDFIVKPFDIEEMRVMLQSKLNYVKKIKIGTGKYSDPLEQTLCVGCFTLDTALHAIYIDRKTVELTVMEYKLMKFFFEYPNIVLSAKKLLEEVWDQPVDSLYTIDTSSVRTLIRKLRQKLEENPAHPTYLLTATNGGYLFCPTGAAGAMNKLEPAKGAV